MENGDKLIWYAAIYRVNNDWRRTIVGMPDNDISFIFDRWNWADELLVAGPIPDSEVFAK